MTEGFFQCAVEAADIPGNQGNADKSNAEIGPELLVFEYAPDLADEQQIVAAEVHTEEKHEYGGHILQVGAVAGEGIVAHAEAAGARGAEGIAHRLEGRHAAKQQKKDIRNGQDNVEDVEDGGGFAHPGHQLAYAGPRALRPQQVHGKALAPFSAGHDGQQKHQHTHAAYPVAEAAPIEDAFRQVLHSRQNGSAGGGEAGDDLKQGIDESGDLPGDDKGQAAGQAEDDPAQGDADHAVGGVEVAFGPPAQHPQGGGDGQQDDDGGGKTPDGGVLPQVHADGQGRDHENPFQRQDLGDEAAHHFIVHDVPLRRRCR